MTFCEDHAKHATGEVLCTHCVAEWAVREFATKIVVLLRAHAGHPDTAYEAMHDIADAIEEAAK